MSDSRCLSRDAILAELIFAARALAEKQITRLRGSEELICSECRTKQDAAHRIDHTDNCAAGRVYRALDSLLNLPRVSRDEFAAGDYGEPWSHDGRGHVTDARDRDIADAIGAELGDVAAEVDCMRRIVACVNHCAGMPTEELEAIGVAAASLRPSPVVASA